MNVLESASGTYYHISVYIYFKYFTYDQQAYILLK